MTNGDWLARLPVIGGLPPDQAAVKLREVGEDEIADVLDASGQVAPATYGVLSRLGIGGGPGVAAYRERGRLSRPGGGSGVRAAAGPACRGHRSR